MAKVETESIRIILENGEDIEVTYPTEIKSEVFYEMREAQSRDSFWYIGMHTGVCAMYKGVSVDQINMKRVIGTS